MTCTTCGGALTTDTLAGQEWLKCSRCGAWAGPRAQLEAALPAALAPQPLAWGAPPVAAPPAPYQPAAVAPPVAAPPAPYQPAAGPPAAAAAAAVSGWTPGSGPPTPAQIATAASLLAEAGVLGGAHAPGLVVPVPESPPDLARVPPPPRTPTPMARKLVYGYQGTQKVKLIIGVAFTLVAFPASLPATGSLPGELLLALSATPGTATVTSVARNPSVRMNRRTATRIEFAYTVGGRRYTESLDTIDSHAIALANRQGVPLPIEYASLHPGYARVQGASYSFFGWLAALFLIMPAVGVMLWISAWRSNRREIRAYRHGVAVAAPITKRTYDTSSRVNGRHPRVIRWRFSVAGQQYTGSISHLDDDLLDRTLPGAWVVALYDPQDPRINTVWIA